MMMMTRTTPIPIAIEEGILGLFQRSGTEPGGPPPPRILLKIIKNIHDIVKFRKHVTTYERV